MAFPRSCDRNGITPDPNSADRRWAIPIPGRQQVIGLVVINRTDVDVWVYHPDYDLKEACFIPAGNVRRFEFDREPEWGALEGLLHSDEAVTNSGKVYLEVE